MNDQYPHTCPVCGQAAYLGGENNVECSGAGCRHAHRITSDELTRRDADETDPLPRAPGWDAVVGIPHPPGMPTPLEFVCAIDSSDGNDLLNDHLSKMKGIRTCDIACIEWNGMSYEPDHEWCSKYIDELEKRLAPNFGGDSLQKSKRLTCSRCGKPPRATMYGHPYCMTCSKEVI